MQTQAVAPLLGTAAFLLLVYNDVVAGGQRFLEEPPAKTTLEIGENVTLPCKVENKVEVGGMWGRGGGRGMTSPAELGTCGYFQFFPELGT